MEFIEETGQTALIRRRTRPSERADQPLVYFCPLTCLFSHTWTSPNLGSSLSTPLVPPRKHHMKSYHPKILFPASPDKSLCRYLTQVHLPNLKKGATGTLSMGSSFWLLLLDTGAEPSPVIALGVAVSGCLVVVLSYSPTRRRSSVLLCVAGDKPFVT